MEDQIKEMVSNQPNPRLSALFIRKDIRAIIERQVSPISASNIINAKWGIDLDPDRTDRDYGDIEANNQ